MKKSSYAKLFAIVTFVFFTNSTLQKNYIKNIVFVQDSLQINRDKHIKEISNLIKGNENAPVDSVFDNLQVFGGFPAKNLLVAMNSWSWALGVSCDHCHDVFDFSSDGKPEKQIARQMSNMTEKINSDLIKEIKGLKSKRPIINCTSCHNGKLKPALSIKD